MVFESTEGLKLKHDQNKKQSIFVLDTDYKDSRLGSRKCYEIIVNGAQQNRIDYNCRK